MTQTLSRRAHTERHDTSRAAGALAWQLVQRVDGGGMSHATTREGKRGGPWSSRVAREKGRERDSNSRRDL
jgi:hypothetical protein